MTKALIPFDAREAISVKQAARVANASPSSVRRWAAEHGIGRLVAGRMLISAPALKMLLESDNATLAAYVAGARDPRVEPYFVRCGLEGVLFQLRSEIAAFAERAKCTERA